MSEQDARTLEQKFADLQRENEQLKSQLMQSQKMSSVGALAASITHEFNNILTTTINYAKMGLRHTDEATREKAFTKILNAGQRAAKITTGMLSYARNHNEQKEATDLVQLVEEVLVLVEKDLQIHRVNLETRFEGRPFANVNANQVQQVLLNLIVNGRQAMEGGGRMVIGVLANREANTAEISVRDSGTGIPAEQLQKIFQPFYTTKKADARGQGGTGLGLSMCREVIEAHQGRIRVESQVGEGTTFTLRFPLFVGQGDSPANLRMHHLAS
ncbi:MAG: two-component sensor histidine kinase [Planctomyces sp.]|nr:two-component sensor histidine kinase [Planctomyces sp.]